MSEKIRAGLAIVEERELSRLRDIQFRKDVKDIVGEFGEKVPGLIFAAFRNKETRAKALTLLGFAGATAIGLGLVPTGHAHASADHGPSTPDTGDDLCKRPDVSCFHVTQTNGTQQLVVDFSGGATSPRYFDPVTFCAEVDRQLIELGHDDGNFKCSFPRTGEYCHSATDRSSDYCTNSAEEWSGKPTPLKIGIEVRQLPKQSFFDTLRKKDTPITFDGQVGVLSGGNIVPLDVLTRAIDNLPIFTIEGEQSSIPVYQVEPTSVATATQAFLANPLPVDTLIPNTPVPTAESVVSTPASLDVNPPVNDQVPETPTNGVSPGAAAAVAFGLLVSGAALALRKEIMGAVSSGLELPTGRNNDSSARPSNDIPSPPSISPDQQFENWQRQQQFSVAQRQGEHILSVAASENLLNAYAKLASAERAEGKLESLRQEYLQEKAKQEYLGYRAPLEVRISYENAGYQPDLDKLGRLEKAYEDYRDMDINHDKYEIQDAIKKDPDDSLS